MQKSIPASVFSFLEELKENNNRKWFQEKKEHKGLSINSISIQ